MSVIKTLAAIVPEYYEVYEVESSAFKEVGYNWYQKALYIQYRHGVYKYLGVERETLVELLSAESKGSYINKIKGEFTCVKM